MHAFDCSGANGAGLWDGIFGQCASTAAVEFLGRD